MLKAISKSLYMHSFLLGILAGLSLPPLNALPITIVSITFFFILFLKIKQEKPTLYIYVFMLGYFLVSLCWIGNALLVEGNNYKWAWPLAVFALPAMLSLFYPIIYYLITKLCRPADSNFLKLTCLAQSLMTAELARSFLFTGFPWALLGTSWSQFLPTIQLASIIGILGMTWLMLSLCALIAYALTSMNKKRKYIAISIALTVFAANALYGYFVISSQHESGSGKTNINVIAIQPNIPQHEKWDPQYAQKNMDKLITASEEAIAALQNKNLPIVLIWPETSLSYHHIEQNNFFSHLMNRLTKKQTYHIKLITGALVREIDSVEQGYKYKNAALYINKNGVIDYQYAKTHLVPFGEYIPFQRFIPLKTVTGFNGIDKGDGAEIYSGISGLNLITKICYEIIFPHEFKAKRTAPNHINAIIHITNDGWYGRSQGPFQHQNIATIRAIENNTHVFRSANKGISAIIKPHGMVESKTSINKIGAASAYISLNNSNASIYARFGLWVVLLLTFAPTLAITVLNGYKKKLNY